MGKTWYVVTFKCDAENKDAIAQILYRIGCNGIEEDVVERNPACLKAYFDQDKFPDPKRLSLSLKMKLTEEFADKNFDFSVQSADFDDWTKKWRQSFEPFFLTPGVAVSPTWHQGKFKRNAISIVMDPGMAFGTGLHATTRLCASFLDELAKSIEVHSLIDIGSGSGILSILAKKLGIDKVVAVDNDPDAILVGKGNFDRNSVRDIATYESICDVNDKFQAAIANILLTTLLELKADIINRILPGGYIILSGITHDQEPDIIDSYSNSCSLRNIKRDGEWSSILFSKNEE